MTSIWGRESALLQRFGLDGNILFAFGALFPVFFYPCFVAFAGGGVASGEGYGGDFAVGNLGTLVARGEYQTNYRILQGWADAAIEKVSGDFGVGLSLFLRVMVTSPR